MLSNYAEDELIGIFYFIDPDLVKNKNFYTAELLKMTKDYNVETHIFYGKHLFDYFGYSDIWNEILEYLQEWKKEIPDLTEINFDLEPQQTFEEIKDLKPLVYRKLLMNDDLFNEIILSLFPEKKTLKLLYDYYLTKTETIYRTIANNLSKRIKN